MKFPEGVYRVQSTGQQFLDETSTGKLLWKVVASPVARVDDKGTEVEIPVEYQDKIYLTSVLSERSIEKFVPHACKELGIEFSQKFADEIIDEGKEFLAEATHSGEYVNWSIKLGAPKAGSKSLDADAKTRLSQLFGASKQKAPDSFQEA